MSIEALSCKCCGSPLKMTNGSICECEYCGTINILSGSTGKYVNQLNRANKLRQDKEFDKAARIYDDILAENIPTSEILWYQTLCEYGIEYVQDPGSNRYIPTLHRVKDESILNYTCYVEAIEKADPAQREIIEKEASYIADIQNEYLNIAKNESPYDVFICYKETDDSTGQRTEDSGIALELYERLENYGYKVFFSRVTLQDKLNVNYEPYIFAALKSASVMVVIGTKQEYFNATWVKNEWSRYLKLKEKDKSKEMFFACEDPEDLPRAFSSRQAQKLSEMNAIQNLAFNIKNYISKIGSSSESYSSGVNVKQMYENAVNLSKAGNRNECLNLLEKVVTFAPSFADAHWLRLVVKNGYTLDTIESAPLNFTKDPDYIQALSNAGDPKKQEYISKCEICLENLKLKEEFQREKKSIIENYKNGKEETSLFRKRKALANKLGIRSDLSDLPIVRSIISIILFSIALPMNIISIFNDGSFILFDDPSGFIQIGFVAVQAVAVFIFLSFLPKVVPILATIGYVFVGGCQTSLNFVKNDVSTLGYVGTLISILVYLTIIIFTVLGIQSRIIYPGLFKNYKELINQINESCLKKINEKYDEYSNKTKYSSIFMYTPYESITTDIIPRLDGEFLEYIRHNTDCFNFSQIYGIQGYDVVKPENGMVEIEG